MVKKVTPVKGKLREYLDTKENNPLFCVEKQSSWHDNEDAKKRDELKRNLCDKAGVPIIYTRTCLGKENFWVINKLGEIKKSELNPYNQEGLAKTKELIKFVADSFKKNES